ncbi:Low-density lipoprotein receptor-related protein 2 [Holothuria leucospilota]|uniref:Low-density lipoprotein receptor-related protein 2 n=1 Tax=Holothuria leucospilota TaxID=206669 RepID=A0A9Q0YQB7_HOLLE|nr:Low-density lipoprotein receptor-related protein 2 [Holothuria leucospilota]
MNLLVSLLYVACGKHLRVGRGTLGERIVPSDINACIPTSFVVHGPASEGDILTYVVNPALIMNSIEIQLPEEFNIFGIVTQGTLVDNEVKWATKLTIDYAGFTRDGVRFKFRPYVDIFGETEVGDATTINCLHNVHLQTFYFFALIQFLLLKLFVQVFEANFDSVTPVVNLLERPIAATDLRINYYNDRVLSYSGPCIRFDLIGCKVSVNTEQLTLLCLLENGYFCKKAFDHGSYCMGSVASSAEYGCSTIFHPHSRLAVFSDNSVLQIVTSKRGSFELPGYSKYGIGLVHTLGHNSSTSSSTSLAPFVWEDGTPLLDLSGFGLNVKFDNTTKLCVTLDFHMDFAWELFACDLKRITPASICQFGESFMYFSLTSLLSMESFPLFSTWVESENADDPGCYISELNIVSGQVEIVPIPCNSSNPFLCLQDNRNKDYERETLIQVMAIGIIIGCFRIDPCPTNGQLGIVRGSRGVPSLGLLKVRCLVFILHFIVSCQWHIVPLIFHRLYFLYITLRTYQQEGDTYCLDNLSIWETKANGNKTKQGEYCGELSGFNIELSTNQVSITLEIGEIRLDMPRYLTVQLLYESRDIPGCGLEPMEDDEDVCQDIKRCDLPRAFIASPNFPVAINGQSICRWSITTSPKSYIALTLHNFSIPYNRDCFEEYLLLQDGNRNLRICGSGPEDMLGKPFYFSDFNEIKIGFASPNGKFLASYEETFFTPSTPLELSSDAGMNFLFDLLFYFEDVLTCSCHAFILLCKSNYDEIQPDGGSGEACTAIDIKSLGVTNNWFDVPCAARMTNSFICSIGAISEDDVSFAPTPAVLNVESNMFLFAISLVQFRIKPVPQTSSIAVPGSASAFLFALTEYSSGCLPSQFMCRDGKCIQASFLCDFKDHCLDRSDETSCELFNCSDLTFKCPKSYCIPQHYRCDGKADCPESEDELGCGTYSINDEITIILLFRHFKD